MINKVLLYIIGFLTILSIGVWVYKEREYNKILDTIEERLEEERSKVEEEREADYNELRETLDTARDSVKEVLKHNRYLTKKAKDYEKNPNFDDFTLYEHARYISNYKYDTTSVQHRD